TCGFDLYNFVLTIFQSDFAKLIPGINFLSCFFHKKYYIKKSKLRRIIEYRQNLENFIKPSKEFEKPVLLIFDNIERLGHKFDDFLNILNKITTLYGFIILLPINTQFLEFKNKCENNSQELFMRKFCNIAHFKYIWSITELVCNFFFFKNDSKEKELTEIIIDYLSINRELYFTAREIEQIVLCEIHKSFNNNKNTVNLIDLILNIFWKIKKDEGDYFIKDIQTYLSSLNAYHWTNICEVKLVIKDEFIKLVENVANLTLKSSDLFLKNLPPKHIQ
ncbi:MAG: hypothetical protein ACRC4L_01130, partial [Mycoplasma sp.]